MRFLLAFFFFFITITGYSQCPTGEVVLSSQERVDEFVRTYSTCSRIIANIRIISAVSGVGDDDVGNTEVNDLSGLDFIEEISGTLIISVNITQLNGFKNLRSVSDDIDITNSRTLQSISGFNNLQFAKSLTIALNPILTEIDGFNGLEYLTESLEIGFSDSLLKISGFNKLQTLGKELNISNNLVLQEIPSFNNLRSIENDLNLTSNASLMFVDGFENLEYINNDLNIEDVRTLRGFTNLRKITRFFDIRNNSVEEIPSFDALEEVGAGLRISDTGIRQINGFNNLLRVGAAFFLKDWFILKDNPNLTSVVGFGRFILVDGDLEVVNNTQLSDCSWLCNLINNGEITGDFLVQNNLGTCLNTRTIIELCDPDFDDDTIADVIDVDDDNDGILDVDEGNGNLDTDGDGFPDTKDLDSDGDECFDVIEAGFSDPNNDGVLGDLPDEVDINGRIINESTGYTPAQDLDNNGTPDFQESTLLDPGENNIVEFCPTSPQTDLTTRLLGTPDAGGVWSPALISGTGVFDPINDEPGLYTYTHFDPLCGERSAQLLVEIPSRKRAGIDTEVIICGETEAFNLFNRIDGNPSRGGLWAPQLASEENIFDPNVDELGVYRYTVIDAFCGPISTEVTVVRNVEPNAGVSNVIEICEFAQPIDLFEFLGGEPSTNGVWSFTNRFSSIQTLSNGFFDPRLRTSETFTYTVDNGPCGVATASVEVRVIENKALDNVNIVVNDFSSTNNRIRVFVSSTREFEYSLDGINYQDENTFNNVEGGKQTVYIKGKDGCQFYEEEVFVKAYPVFFTPNNDGKNDFWRITHFPDVPYKIYFYNRFGNLLREVDSGVGFWDGTQNGIPMQSNDYWFKVVTETGEIYHGNFSLLRN